MIKMVTAKYSKATEMLNKKWESLEEPKKKLKTDVMKKNVEKK